MPAHLRSAFGSRRRALGRRAPEFPTLSSAPRSTPHDNAPHSRNPGELRFANGRASTASRALCSSLGRFTSTLGRFAGALDRAESAFDDRTIAVDVALTALDADKGGIGAHPTESEQRAIALDRSATATNRHACALNRCPNDSRYAAGTRARPSGPRAPFGPARDRPASRSSRAN